MGTFFILNSHSSRETEAQKMFQRGLSLGTEIGLPGPIVHVDLDWCRGAHFPRSTSKSVSGGALDSKTNSFVMVSGVCFFRDRSMAADESQILERYLHTGADRLADDLEGFFAIVIGDGRSRELTLITDIVGSCHVFFRSLPFGMGISGSSRLLGRLQSAAVDPIACQEFIATGNIYEDRTLYAPVKKFGPARIVRIGSGTLVREQPYWQVGQLNPRAFRGEQAVDATWQTLTQAAKKIHASYPRLVCDLTGGYDSRSAVAGFVGSGSHVTTTVSGASSSPDVVIAGRLSRLLSLPHLHVRASPIHSALQIADALPFTDGEYELSEYASILSIHRQLAERFDASINGSFGELARGYWWEQLLPYRRRQKQLNYARVARQRLCPHSPLAPLIRPELRLDFEKHFTEVVERNNQGLRTLPNTMQLDHAYLGLRMQRWQGRIASSTNRLWPCLSIFAFRSLLETILQCDPAVRKHSLLIRKMLARYQPEMAAFPLEHGYPAEPLSYKNIHRFWPIAKQYAVKVENRLWPSSRGRTASDQPTPLRLVLWRDALVREAMLGQASPLRDLMGRGDLDNFLSSSQAINFPFESQWLRLLTLQVALAPGQLR